MVSDMADKIDPSSDGKEHINCWTKGRTWLGQELSNLAETRFKHPEHGTFGSVEAYWYWLSTGRIHNVLRPLFGHSAKSSGMKLPKVEIDEEEFKNLIREAVRLKIEQNPPLKKEFIESTLPFMHYFVYGRDAIRDNPKHAWQMEWLEQLRTEMRAEMTPPQ